MKPIPLPVLTRASPKFLAWDVTAPDDTEDFAWRMQKDLHWENHFIGLRPGDWIEESRKYKIYIYMPCGLEGTILDDQLFYRYAPSIQQELFDLSTFHPGIFYVSGHGIPGFIFSERNVLIGTSSIIGAAGDPGKLADPEKQWDNPDLKYIIFSTCRQLEGKPQQALWARAMRGKHPVHGILGYRDTSPEAGNCSGINNRFITGLKEGKTFLHAWRDAHPEDLSQRWAVLIHKSALDDKIEGWSISGRLDSVKDPRDDILYFDESNFDKGEVVSEPKRNLNVILTQINGEKVDQWVPAKDKEVAFLNIKFTDVSSSAFEKGDRIWIAVLQVRPTYAIPVGYDIRRIFSIISTKDKDKTVVSPTDQETEKNGIRAISKVRSRGINRHGDLDTYEFKFPETPEESKKNWFDISRDNRKISLLIRWGGYTGKRHPIFYFMVRVRKKNGKTFGIPTTGPSESVDQNNLKDDFQFAVFLLNIKSPSWYTPE